MYIICMLLISMGQCCSSIFFFFGEMAEGFVAGGPSGHLYEYRRAQYFIFACIVAALGGSLFGYELWCFRSVFIDFSL